MTVSVRKPERIVPEYSLTGDVLSFLRCGLQYRLYNRGALPPSKPVQQWFGEFIHGVMEEAYLRWKNQSKKKSFPWSWIEVIQPIESDVHGRLLARGLKPSPQLFLRYRGSKSDFSKLRRLASYRAEAAINTWAPHLFPLVQAAEVRLKGSRPISNCARTHRYTVSGVVDVLSSVELRNADSENLIVAELLCNPRLKKELETGAAFDIIVDYKGMRRPTLTSDSWNEHAWQLQTYAWLRQEQAPDRRVIAGALLYLNELTPARADVSQLIDESQRGETDWPAIDNDINDLQRHLRTISTVMRKHNPDENLLAEYEMSQIHVADSLRIRRSLRLVEIDDGSILSGLNRFDATVSKIEDCIYKESASGTILRHWPERFDPRTCVACDFKYQCPTAKSKLGEKPTVP